MSDDLPDITGAAGNLIESMPVLLVGPDGFPFAQDGETQGLVVMESLHSLVHHGRLFDATAYSASLANAANLDVLIQTGPAAFHVRFHAAAGGPMLCQLYEGATFSNAGTAMTANNRNRNSATTLGAVLTSGPTVSGTGTLISRDLVSGGTSQAHAVSGGALSTFQEHVLQPNQDYLFRMTNNSGEAVVALAAVLAYEAA